MSFLTGQPGRYRRLDLLERGQQPLKQQLFGASSGAFQNAADYYRSLLGDDSSTYNALAAPEMRRFNQEIIPSLAEQFAGMGASKTTGCARLDGPRPAGLESIYPERIRAGDARASSAAGTISRTSPGSIWGWRIGKFRLSSWQLFI
jgi:hypothetical protein